MREQDKFLWWLLGWSKEFPFFQNFQPVILPDGFEAPQDEEELVPKEESFNEFDLSRKEIAYENNPKNK